MRKKLILGALVGALTLVAVPVAMAVFSQTSDVKLTVKKVAKPTGVSAILTASDPDQPGGKPKVATRVVVSLPKGTKYDARGAVQCNGLSDGEVLNGECPAKSVIGDGSAIANAYPVIPTTKEDVTAYHTKGGVIFRLTDNAEDPQPGQPLVLRAKLSKKGVIDVNVPPLVLPTVPPTKVALTDFRVVIKPKTTTITVRGKRIKVPLIRSPKTCSGTWSTFVDFTYDDGSKLNDLKTTKPCTKPPRRR